MNMKDDVTFNIKFLELVKNYTCLYDNGPVNQAEKSKAWQEIAAKLNVTSPECKDRFKNIRTCYSRYLKNSSVPGKHGKPYYLATYLAFLDGSMKNDSKRSSNKSEQDSESSSEDEDFSPTPIKQEVQYNSQTEETIQLPIIYERNISPNDLNGSRVEYSNSRNKEKKRGKQDPDIAFLHSVLPDMKEMTSEQKRRFKIGILNLAGEILKE